MQAQPVPVEGRGGPNCSHGSGYQFGELAFTADIVAFFRKTDKFSEKSEMAAVNYIFITEKRFFVGKIFFLRDKNGTFPDRADCGIIQHVYCIMLNEVLAMNISQFALSRNLKYQTVSIYIKRHPELFDGHLHRVSKSLELDDAALALLEKKYPDPTQLSVMDGVPTDEHLRVVKALEQAQDEIIRLQNELRDLSSAQLLLEDRERQLEDLRTELECFQPAVFGLYRKKKKS